MPTDNPSGWEGKNVSPLRQWVHAILPLVYDDSLTYYEVLAKVSAKMNEVIEGLNANNEQVEKVTGFTVEQVAQLTTQFTTFTNSINEKQTAYENKINGEWDSYKRDMTNSFNSFTTTTSQALSRQINEQNQNIENFKTSESNARKAFEANLEGDLATWEADTQEALENQYNDFLSQYKKQFGVVQAAGNSDTDVISQKAITHQLPIANGLINVDNQDEYADEETIKVYRLYGSVGLALAGTFKITLPIDGLPDGINGDNTDFFSFIPFEVYTYDEATFPVYRTAIGIAWKHDYTFDVFTGAMYEPGQHNNIVWTKIVTKRSIVQAAGESDADVISQKAITHQLPIANGIVSVDNQDEYADDETIKVYRLYGSVGLALWGGNKITLPVEGLPDGINGDNTDFFSFIPFEVYKYDEATFPVYRTAIGIAWKHDYTFDVFTGAMYAEGQNNNIVWTKLATKRNIVQKAGESDADVISQKAITHQLPIANGLINVDNQNNYADDETIKVYKLYGSVGLALAGAFKITLPIDGLPEGINENNTDFFSFIPFEVYTYDEAAFPAYRTAIGIAWKHDYTFDVFAGAMYDGVLGYNIVWTKISNTSDNAVYDKIYIIGDSISHDMFYETNFSEHTWSYYIKSTFPHVICLANANATISESNVDNNMKQQLAEIVDPSLIIMFAGVNDTGPAFPASEEEFKSGLENIKNELQTKFAKAPVIVATPLSTSTPPDTPNTKGLTLNTVRELLTKFANDNQYELLNLNNANYNMQIETIKNAFSHDGVHPNEYYQKNILLPKFVNAIKNV